MSDSTTTTNTSPSHTEDTPTIHIPAMQGEVVHGLSIGTFDVTTTVLSTWMFMALLVPVLVLFRLALIHNTFPRIRGIGISIITTLDTAFADFIGDATFARRCFGLIAGLFLFILFGNLFSLFLDWIVVVSAPSTAVHYLRPINSDLNTTLAMAAIVIVLSQAISIRSKGIGTYLKNFFFHATGPNAFERGINVFVGWLHFIGEITRLLSLSLRLFGNIFAGVVLISVMTFIGSMISFHDISFGNFLVLPFWLFELFVAVIQAVVFVILTMFYFRDARSHH